MKSLWVFSVFVVYLCSTSCGASYDIDDSTGLGREFFGIGGLSGGGGQYVLDDTTGLGRTFDGIGALDAGATSKLLINYDEPYRSQILDYLFKPNFGASLHILKVEIGGDAQSTDGTESSHMHESWDENYARGYEWWLMLEAKKRNPNIKLYALPWAFPGWVGKGSGSPYKYPNVTSEYVTKWILGARKFYNLTIDYIGVWNERPYDTTYVKTLRSHLNDAGLSRVQIVAADGGWGVADDILKDPAFAAAVDFIGVHYPGTTTTDTAMKTGKNLWSSEDYSTFNDEVGGGCWARILNQNYVNGYMTSTISWNLIASYYESLPFGRDGLMTAEAPWSNSYVVESPIWVSAHTTQFTEIGWSYLKHGSGVGKLDKGGSYVTLMSPGSKDFTMVIETMSHDHSVCIRPALPPYTVSPQEATFTLKGSMSHVTSLNVWYSKFGYNGNPSEFFTKMSSVQVKDGQFSMMLDVDVMYTITTMSVGMKGSYPDSPAAMPFPLPYMDDFEAYDPYSEAYNLVPQIGVWEVRDTGDKLHGKVNQQVVLNHPINWCGGETQHPINMIGNITWSDIYVQSEVYIPKVNGSTGAFLAAQVSKGGCGADSATGVFFVVDADKKTYLVSTDLAMTKILIQGDLPDAEYDSWMLLALLVKGNSATGYVGTKQLFMVSLSTSGQGYAAMGTTTFGVALFDNFVLKQV